MQNNPFLGVESELYISWVTFNVTDTPVVEYGLNIKLNLQETAKTAVFTDGGSEKRFLYTHTARLTNLKPSEAYCKIIQISYVYHLMSFLFNN